MRHVATGPRRVNEFRQHIARSHDNVENVLGLLDAIITQPVEQRFENMSKLDERGKAKAAAPALIEWTALKIAFRVSKSTSPTCKEERRSSKSGRISAHSSKKVARKRSNQKTLIRSRTSSQLPLSLRAHLVEDLQQLFGCERFHDPPGGTGVPALRLLVVAALGGQDQDRRGLEFRLSAKTLDERYAIHVWHVDIGDDRIHGRARKHVESLRPVFGFNNIEACAFNVKETMSRMVLQSSTVRMRLRMSWPPLAERMGETQIVKCGFES